MAALAVPPAATAAAPLDDAALAARGVLRVRCLDDAACARWAAVARVVSPLLAAQDDGDGAPHANDLLEEPGFPFAAIFAAARSAVARFHDPAALELYDGFTLHYDAAQHDTTFNRHRDPSYVTVNLCLHSDCAGSDVEFFGEGADDADAGGRRFRAAARVGHALVHYGRHLHQTTPLVSGSRSQAVLYYTRKGVVGDNEATYGAYVPS